MNFDDVDAIGQGRVWTAKDAIEIGLVDEIGGLQDAIAYVAEKAEIDAYRIVSYPEKEDPFNKILESLSSEARQTLIKMELGDEAFKLYTDYKTFMDQEGLQMRIPFNYSIN